MFNRDDIVDCALELLARNGIEALTMRGLARALGCVLGTINYHFENLADLEDAVAARLQEQLPVLDATRPEPLREQLVALGLALIDLHSRHPYLRQAAGPISIEIAARQLRQHWSTFQALGYPEHVAMLCMEVLQSLAHSRGTQIHRLQNGGESALRLNEEFLRKLGKAPAIKLTAASYTAKNMAPYHRVIFGTAIDTFLRHFEAGDLLEAQAAVILQQRDSMLDAASTTAPSEKHR